VYRVQINAGGSPYLVASTKLTPLFQADGKDAAVYVGDAYFIANPGRTPSTIQPGDQFSLTLPASTFVVRWQAEHRESFGHEARLREYVSERGDRLRYYLTEPFPILYELQTADQPGRGVIRFDPELRYLLQSGRTDPARLAQLVYRVTDPDVFQLAAMQRLAAELQVSNVATYRVDRTRGYLDPVRELLTRPVQSEAVEAIGRDHLRRHIAPADGDFDLLAVEDALANLSSPLQIEDGRVFRILYRHDGIVQVWYKTGHNDTLGKRDPYGLRENERWSELYQRLAPGEDTPIKWGPGEPDDLDPFPSARDPLDRTSDPRRDYDYLVSGRVLTLTFRPQRFRSDLRAETEFRYLLGNLRERFRPQIDDLVHTLESHLAQEEPVAP
jgi:hypothetical protein